jgi:S1-C subfamily serine protease
MKLSLSPRVRDRARVMLAVTLAFCAVPFAMAQVPAAVPPAVAAKITPAEDPMLTRVFPSIVRIEVIRLRPSDGRLTKQWTAGSGVIISAEGHVVTNCHVTEDGDYYRCYLYDGTHVEGRRLGQDPLTDLAVLQLDLSQRPPGAAPLVVTKFGDSDKLAAWCLRWAAWVFFRNR